uniref:tubulin polyglutamylase complex subunit 2 isoform X3 n=1 Tax=Nyctereutes procyonoides TaxID=34880 RepID=UPI00244443FD|nr:tubulin polyglutamylase complex subunit 2 isoform X3 [Nyctereutes procyonoides]
MSEPLGRRSAVPPARLSRRVPAPALAARGAGTRAMEETPPPGCSKPHLEKLTLGITRILESSPGVTEVTIIEKPPAERHMISSWEQKNNCMLPEDVKNFYLMTNGFHMTWSVKLDEHTIPLGSMAINSISKLTQLNQSSVYSLPNAPTLADLEDDTLEGFIASSPGVEAISRNYFLHSTRSSSHPFKFYQEIASNSVTSSVSPSNSSSFTISTTSATAFSTEVLDSSKSCMREHT